MGAPEHESDLAAAIGTNTCPPAPTPPEPPPNPHLAGLETVCPDLQAKTPGTMFMKKQPKFALKGRRGWA